MKQKLLKPKKEWARLYTDESKESLLAINLLRNSGYRVITFPVCGKMGPELLLGRRTYRGLREMEKLIKEVNNGSL